MLTESRISSPPPASPARPAMAPTVRMVAADGEPARYTILNTSNGRFLRMGAAEWAVLSSLDGARSVDELAASFGAAADRVAHLCARFAELGLLQDAVASHGRRPAGERVLWETDPTPLLRRLAPVARALCSSAGAAVIAVLLVGAAVCGAVDRAPATYAFGGRLGPVTFVAVAATLLLGVVVHELAHGATLVAVGGEARRIGVRLSRRVPVAFCDVSDAWRLPGRSRRATVAAAGVASHLVVAAISWLAAVVAAWHIGRPAEQYLVILALANTIFAVGNALPFPPADGYWALSLWTGLPNVAARAGGYLRLRLTSLVLRTPAPAPPGPRPWAWLAYAAAWRAARPAVVVCLAVSEPAFVGHGPVAVVAWLVAASAVVVAGVVRLVGRAFAIARAVPGRFRRLLPAVAVLVGAGALALPLPGLAPHGQTRSVAVWTADRLFVPAVDAVIHVRHGS